jgi:NAD(P)-dependent dehydrogenase (short-subunit alcohol dehydrogenase family)
VEISGKTAIVTGGAVRIGQAISLELAKRGSNVCLHYCASESAARETVGEICRLGARAVAVRADLSNSGEAALAIFDRTVAEFGAVDVLVNNAAIFEEGSLADTTEENWDRHFAVNLKAPFLLCREFARRRAPGRRGHIINIADWRGTRPVPGHLAYTLTKSAIVAMTRILAQELAPDVQVNAVAPGAILPPPGGDRASFDRLAQGIPLKRTGSPGEIARTVCYLLQSDFITGEVVHVAGGEQL